MIQKIPTENTYWFNRALTQTCDSQYLPHQSIWHKPFFDTAEIVVLVFSYQHNIRTCLSISVELNMGFTNNVLSIRVNVTFKNIDDMKWHQIHKYTKTCSIIYCIIFVAVKQYKHKHLKYSFLCCCCCCCCCNETWSWPIHLL